MNIENIASSKDITREFGFGHGDVMGQIRMMLEKGEIESVRLARYQNPQNKRNFDMFLLDGVDIELLLSRLARVDEKWPVKTITKEMKSYVMSQFDNKCFNCKSDGDVFVSKIDEAGRICSRNLQVICGCCSDDIHRPW